MLHFRYCFALLIAGIATLLLSTTLRAQDVSELNDKIKGIDERTTTLEAAVAKIQQLKISGYIQPQWQWQDIDSGAVASGAGIQNQQNNRNFFTIRRGRVKFQHTTDNVYYTLYPDITESGVVMKEVYAGWKITPVFDLSMGAMNRPFGYEIAYSSSSREVTERSLAENRLFNGERDLGIQFAVTPTLGTLHPLLELGIFNGSDNFGKGPVLFNSGSFGSPAANGGSLISYGTNGSYFPASAAVGGAPKVIKPSGADSLLNLKIAGNLNLINTGIIDISKGVTDMALFDNNGGGFRQDGRELMGHLRFPFLLSDDFSFDVGGSWSIGGINEPTDLLGHYNGVAGKLLVLSNGTAADGGGPVSDRAGRGPSGAFNPKFGSESGGFLSANRSVFGADAQFYLSVLPIGGTIVKVELYSGHVPFYGTSNLFTHEDSSLFGAPRPSTVIKNVMGYYAMLVQNLMDGLQIGLRYDVYDPNTDVVGTDFATSGRGLNASAGFGGDLKQTTITADVNVFISGAMRLMFDYDHVTTEDYTRVNAGTTYTVTDPKDDRFTFRMQYKF